LPLPIAEVLAGIPEAVEELSYEVGLMLVMSVIKSECEKIAGVREIPKLIAALQQKNLDRKEVAA
jgi:hypothetical protein